MSWTALSKGDIAWTTAEEKEARRETARSTYADIETLIHFTCDFLTLDLERFKEQSGKDRLALASARAKTKSSFTDKFLALGDTRKDSRLDRKYSDNKPTLSIFELINDLVGARLVFYFERDIQDAVLYWMSYPVFIPVETIDWTQDSSGLDNDGVRWWRKEVQPGKPSGYESLHFVIRLDTDMLKARLRAHVDNITGAEAKRAEAAVKEEQKWKQLLEELQNPRFFDDLKHVHFEVQCRTILEHTWAEVEHRSNYSLAKAGQTAGDHDALRKKFRSYKAILRSAQILQNTLRSGFTRWDEKRDFIIGRNTHCELGPRDYYWKDRPEELHIHRSLQSLFKHALSHPDGWERVFEEIGKLFASLPPDQRVLSTNCTAEEYGRARLLYLYLGFVLGYCPHTDISKDKAEAYRRFRERVAGYFLQTQFPRIKELKIPTEAVAIRAYETVRLLDEYHTQRQSGIALQDSVGHFYDPLVNVRLASVYYRHFGSFRRSTQLYSEAFTMVEKSDIALRRDSVILTKEYIGKRIAENLWTAYHLDGHQLLDLSDARERAKETYQLLIGRARGDAVSQELKFSEVRQTLPGLILTMELAHARHELKVPTVFGCSEHLLWRVIEEVVTQIREDKLYEPFSNNYTAMQDQIMTDNGEDAVLRKSLRLQGLAIWMACQATAGDARAKQSLGTARHYIRKARNNVADKVQQNRGGAIPFHEDVARDVEEFIFALSFPEVTPAPLVSAGHIATKGGG